MSDTQNELPLVSDMPQPLRRADVVSIPLRDLSAEVARARADGLKPTATVARVGMLQPIVVKWRDGRWHVVDGLRRLLAAADAEWPRVLARVVVSAWQSDTAALTLVANTDRSPNALAELRALEQLQAHRYAPEVIAQELAIPVAHVYRRLRLQRLVPVLRDLFDCGMMTVGAAEAASALSSSRQHAVYDLAMARAQEVLRKRVERGGPDVEVPAVRVHAHDVRAVQEVQRGQVVSQMPDALFGGPAAPAGQEVAFELHERMVEVLRSVAGRLAATHDALKEGVEDNDASRAGLTECVQMVHDILADAGYQS